MVMDRVCGMDVDEQADERVRFRGRFYHFCSRECRDEFRASPEEFVEDDRPSETAEAA